MHRPTGPRVQFVVQTRHLASLTGDVPKPGQLRRVGGATCVVKRVVELEPGKFRIFVEPEA